MHGAPCPRLAAGFGGDLAGGLAIPFGGGMSCRRLDDDGTGRVWDAKPETSWWTRELSFVFFGSLQLMGCWVRSSSLIETSILTSPPTTGSRSRTSTGRRLGGGGGTLTWLDGRTKSDALHSVHRFGPMLDNAVIPGSANVDPTYCVFPTPVEWPIVPRRADAGAGNGVIHPH